MAVTPTRPGRSTRRSRALARARTNPAGSPLKPGGVDDIHRRSLRQRLEREVRGEVLFDAGHRAIYSHDSSNYRQPPIGVVVPRDADDVVAAVAACRGHGAPLTSRGCGTSLAGQTCNVAVILDHSKHRRAIIDLDPE